MNDPSTPESTPRQEDQTADPAADQAEDQAEVLSRRTLCEGSFLRLVAEEIRMPHGQETTLEIFRHPGAAAVIPLTADGRVLLLRQYRHAVGGWLWEVPAGKLDPGESPRACAARELIEETGFAAGALTELGPIVSSPGFTDETIHLFLARNLSPAQQHLDNDELLTVEAIPFEQALAMAVSGEINDSKSVCALFRAERHLGSGRPGEGSEGVQ